MVPMGFDRAQARDVVSRKQFVARGSPINAKSRDRGLRVGPGEREETSREKTSRKTILRPRALRN